MRLVVDSNIVFSALVRDSVTRQLLFHPLLELFAPALLFEELQKHKEEIQQKAGLSYEDFERSVRAFKQFIRILPVYAYLSHVQLASSVVDDPGDFVFAAAALFLAEHGGCGLWTNDKHFLSREGQFAAYGVSLWPTEKLRRLVFQKPL